MEPEKLSGGQLTMDLVDILT